MTEALEGLYTNVAVVAGVVSWYGVRTSFEERGTQRATFAVLVKEENPEGRVFQHYIEVDCWGKAAATADALEPGMPVLVEGKLIRTKRQKKGTQEDQWVTTVLGYRVHLLPGGADVRQEEA